ncbi:ABC transporter ATP-binding protein [Winogradskyella litoriviva]|uniref:ABC transporter ATP-binding protein n=1 Tax=Winogradskyella litoriviva TaxID=1220182 RepID=A0ABX2E2X8_9FLAO|nr:ABC transporter ATP-binding protein [Winogradskyella litoriviva]NRD22833.1 ABC transporter ATP-binding protein [Winogradskyella litoriviva]
MDTDIILKVENIGKQYRLGLVGTGTISHDLNRWWNSVRGKEDPYLKVGEVNNRSKKGSSDYVWALKDINFEVKKGEVLGIIGKNGAGKSTLLKILSRVTSPTTGEIKTKGRIASLLEVGTGFHPEMTGRENIYLNGAILGMTRAEINSKIDEIIDFSGCIRYVDTPVKRYSSGMKVRLAFAVAAHLEPDILVIDEVLAVGDAEFQKKAIGKMQDISNSDGRTVLFVSHDMGAIKNLCTRCVILNNGNVQSIRNTREAIEEYLTINISKSGSFREFVKRPTLVRMLSAEIKNKGISTTNFHSGDDVEIIISIENDEHIPINIFIGLYDEYGEKVAHIGNTYSEFSIKKESTTVAVVLKKIPFVEGRFQINLSLHAYGKPHHREKEAFIFEVSPGDYYGVGKNVIRNNGKFLINASWDEI